MNTRVQSLRHLRLRIQSEASAADRQGPYGQQDGRVLELLRRPDGVTKKDLMKVSGWQAHSMRGFLSGTVGKKMSLTDVSSNGEDGERSYSIEG